MSDNLIALPVFVHLPPPPHHTTVREGPSVVSVLFKVKWHEKNELIYIYTHIYYTRSFT